MSLAWIIALAVVAVLVLRRRSEITMDIPEAPQPPTPSLPDEEDPHAGSAARKYDIDQDWEGALGDEEYFVECLEPEHWTVSITMDSELTKKLEVNARQARPSGPFGEGRDADIKALLEDGATYIDIGFNTNWVAAEFPIREKRLDKSRAEKIVSRLLKLRELSV